MQRRIVIPIVFGVLIGVLAMVAGLYAGASIAQAAPAFDSPLPLPPDNDMFANAAPIDGTPFSSAVNGSFATLEANEQQPQCTWWGGCPPIVNSVWYRISTNTPQKVRLTAYMDPQYAGVYCYYRAYGEAIWDLSEYNCIYFDGSWPATEDRWVYPGEVWYVRIGMTDPSQAFSTWFHLDVTQAPPPQVSIEYHPNPPNTLSVVTFSAYVGDEPGETLVTWSFGDGSAPVQRSLYNGVSHQYVKDGDYIVTAHVVTPDGREAEAATTVYVRTRDLSITKFSVPKTASVGQMKQIVVGITNPYNPEYATVRLYRVDRNDWGGTQWVQVGEATNQWIPASKRGTIDFVFRYTFTPDDGRLGSVVFAASVDVANDANNADNTAQALPVKVSSSLKAAETGDGDMIDQFEYVVPPALLYLPLIEQR